MVSRGCFETKQRYNKSLNSDVGFLQLFLLPVCKVTLLGDKLCCVCCMCHQEDHKLFLQRQRRLQMGLDSDVFSTPQIGTLSKKLEELASSHPIVPLSFPLLPVAVLSLTAAVSSLPVAVSSLTVSSMAETETSTTVLGKRPLSPAELVPISMGKYSSAELTFIDANLFVDLGKLHSQYLQVTGVNRGKEALGEKRLEIRRRSVLSKPVHQISTISPQISTSVVPHLPSSASYTPILLQSLVSTVLPLVSSSSFPPPSTELDTIVHPTVTATHLQPLAIMSLASFSKSQPKRRAKELTKQQKQDLLRTVNQHITANVGGHGGKLLNISWNAVETAWSQTHISDAPRSATQLSRIYERFSKLE